MDFDLDLHVDTFEEKIKTLIDDDFVPDNYDFQDRDLKLFQSRLTFLESKNLRI